jgi:DNA mismatch endonuclease (patch repair protein)
LPGRPDFVFRRQHVCVFVDGCFWHGCPRCYRRPSSNRKYWDEKVKRNRARDRRVNQELRRRGWRVLRFWEHDLEKPNRILSCFISRSPNRGKSNPTRSYNRAEP